MHRECVDKPNPRRGEFFCPQARNVRHDAEELSRQNAASAVGQVLPRNEPDSEQPRAVSCCAPRQLVCFSRSGQDKRPTAFRGNMWRCRPDRSSGSNTSGWSTALHRTVKNPVALGAARSTLNRHHHAASVASARKPVWVCHAWLSAVPGQVTEEMDRD